MTLGLLSPLFSFGLPTELSKTRNPDSVSPTCNRVRNVTRRQKTTSLAFVRKPTWPNISLSAFQNLNPARQVPIRPHWPSGRNIHATHVYVGGSRLKHARLPCSIPHFSTNGVGGLKTGGRWPLLGLHRANAGFCCWADTWRRS